MLDRSFVSTSHFCGIAALVLLTQTHADAQSLGACGAGTVGVSGGGPFDVLRVDGSVGGSQRRVDFLTGQPFTLGVDAPPGQPNANFALFLNAGVPTPAEATPLPFGIGTMCFAPIAVLLPAATAPFQVPLNGLGIPLDLTMQGIMFDASQPFSLALTNGLILRFRTACGTGGPAYLTTRSAGSAATTGHYALGFCATIQDPNPKLIGPGHLFTPSAHALIRLASIQNPGVAIHDHAWSGGDEVGYYRGRMAVDGSTPGIDRIFFVARNTTRAPNFVDWDGNNFANETTLPAASGGIQRLWVMPDGDLCGNDFSGNVYLWDKQSGYTLVPLFQFTNTPNSVPWGSSLDLALGQPAYDPSTGTILLPIDNDAISASGQLYGFDLAGNRVFVDQNLMGTPLDGSGSTDFGVTVDLQNPLCRVLAHGGKNGGSMFVARFVAGMQQKVVTTIQGDGNGGWQGVLIGDRFWTNTNNLSYGVVERSLPSDW